MSIYTLGTTIETQMGTGKIIEVRDDEIEFAGPYEKCFSKGGIVVVELSFKLANNSKALLYLSTEKRVEAANEYMEHHREVLAEMAAEAEVKMTMEGSADNFADDVTLDIDLILEHKDTNMNNYKLPKTQHVTDTNTGFYEMHVQAAIMVLLFWLGLILLIVGVDMISQVLAPSGIVPGELIAGIVLLVFFLFQAAWMCISSRYDEGIASQVVGMVLVSPFALGMYIVYFVCISVYFVCTCKFCKTGGRQAFAALMFPTSAG